MPTDLEGLSFEIEVQSSKANTSVRTLASNMEKLKTAVAGIEQTAGKIETFTKAVGSLKSDSAQKMIELQRSLLRLSKTGEIPKALIDSIGDLNGALKQISNTTVRKAERLAKAVSILQKSQGGGSRSPKAPAIPNPAMQPAQDMGTVNMPGGDGSGPQEMSGGLAEATMRLKEFGKVAKSLGLKSLSVAFHSVATGAKVFAKAMGAVGSAIGSKLAARVKATTSALGGFLASLKRIAMYRAIRALFSIMTKMFKEGIKDLYAYSNAIGGQFATSMNTLSTEFIYLRNSLAGLAEPIINAVTPAIETMIDGFVQAINWLNQFIAILTGADTYTIAEKASVGFSDLTDSTNKANKAAQKYKNTILGFDEINALNDPNSGSSGSGGGNGGGSGFGAFEGKVVDAENSLAKALREAWLSNDLEGLFDVGGRIGEAMKNGLDGIDWASIEAKANTLGEKFSTTIAGIYSTQGLGKSIGNTISGAINTGMSLVEGLIDGTRFDNLGDFLANIVAGAVSFDTEQMNRIATKLGTGVADAINSFATSDSEPLRKVGRAVGAFISAGINLWYSFVTTIKFSEIGQKIADGINAALDELEKSDGKGGNGWTKLGESISDSINGVVDMVGTALKNIDWGKVWDGVTDLFGSLELKSMSVVLATGFAIKYGKNGGKAITSVGMLIHSVLTSSGWTLPAFSEAAFLTGGIALGTIALTATLAFALKGTEVGDDVDPIGDVIKSNLGLTDAQMATWKRDKRLEQTVNGQVIYKPGFKVSDTAKDKLKEIGASLKKNLDNAWDTVKDADLKVKASISTKGSELKSKIETEWSSIKDFAVGVKAKAEGGMQTLRDTFKEKWDKLKENTKKVPFSAKASDDAANKLRISIANAWNKLDTGLRTLPVYAKISTSVQTMVKNLKAEFDRESKKGGLTFTLFNKSGQEKGGVFSNGTWSNIPQFASGGIASHGTTFVAGENGAEVVGHINGRTEVLNRSQMASTMYSAMSAGMKGFESAIRQTSEVSGARQEAILREQNEILLQILAKDNRAEITTNSIVSSMSRKNRRDGKTVVPIGV